MSDLDPLMQLFGRKPPETVHEMREMLETFAGFLNQGLPEVGAFHEAVSVSEGVTADVVVPPGAGPHPVLVYLHGGGWVCGSPSTHRKLAHRFAEAGYLVFNVDYRLAPEHPFPTPLDDCIEAIRWAARTAPEYGGDPSRLAVGGDSAGANLSAASAIQLAGDPACPKAALLIYGVFDFATIGDMPDELAATGPMLELGERLVGMMVEAYLGPDRSEALLADPRISPLHAAHRLPPSHVMVGTADPLARQAEALAKALAAADVAHEHHVDHGMPHGYVQMEFLAPTRPAIERMVDFLRRHV
ncbi:MAG: alpha/beta hydrolase [Deltaproteobacteria bacterium]|nr:alpha/beta hydrolase [Deltaproteobacteria bacterium]